MPILAILNLLKNNWRIVAIAACLMSVFYAGYHTHTWIYEAEEAKAILSAQRKADEKTKEINLISKDYEAYRNKSQAQINLLTQRWSKDRVKATDCSLPSGAISLHKGNTPASSADTR